MTENSLPVNQDRLLNTFFALIAFNTPSRSEEAASKWAASYLQNIGFTCRWDDAGEKVNGSVGNLFAFKKGTVADAPSIFFSSHLDTVEPTPNLTWEVDGDTIRSTSDTILGADDKCGVAPILEAMTLLHESGEAHGDIQIILTICEEIGLVGAKLIDTADIHAQYGFVLDSGPPIGSLLHSAPSQNSLLVTIEGVPSHAGSSPEKGISAIVAASKAISKMTLGRIDSETTANIGTITGGSGRNVVPAKVVIHAEARSMNAEKLAEQTRHMVTIFEQEAAAMGAKATVEVTEQYHTYRLNDDDAVIRLARQAGEMCGFTVATRPTGGGSDANFFNRKGVPTTVLATGMQKVHTHDEFCSIQAMVQDAEWVLQLSVLPAIGASREAKMSIYLPADAEFTSLEQRFGWFASVLMAEYGEEGYEDSTIPDALNWLLLVPETVRYDFEETECNLAFVGESGYTCTIWEAFPDDEENRLWAVVVADDFGVRLLPEYSLFDETASEETIALILRRATDELPDRLHRGEFDRDGIPVSIPKEWR